MDERSPIFRYRLAPLLRRDDWECDALGVEVLRARRALEQAEAMRQAGRERVAAAEAQMRDLHREDQPIALDVRRLLQLHLRHEYAALALREQETAQAELVHEQARARLETKRLAVKTLEKHRDRQFADHATEQARREQRQADELWLTRQR